MTANGPPTYDRALIAEMLADYAMHPSPAHSLQAIAEQIRLLQKADNRDAAGVHTTAIATDYAAAIARAEAAERDAARLNFLRCGGWEVMQDPKYWPKHLGFDGAIDAAIAAQQADGVRG